MMCCVCAAVPSLEYDRRYDDLSSPVGGLLRLSVLVGGEPAPSITWYKGASELMPRRGISLDTTDPALTTLLIRQLHRHDAGEYRVVAKNQWGSKEVTFNIHVQGNVVQQHAFLLSKTHTLYNK